MKKNAFDVIILIGRPASGKSEIIHFLTYLPPEVRQERYHIAHFDVHDDFPMLWVWFEEDEILSEKFGLPRLHTDERGYFKYPELWHLLNSRVRPGESLVSCLQQELLGSEARTFQVGQFRTISRHALPKAFLRLSPQRCSRHARRLEGPWTP